MPALSIVMPFYMNAAMLRRHFEEWASYPPELLNDIEAVIVRQGRRLDRSRVLEEVVPLLDLKEDAESEPRLCRLFGRHPI